MNFEFTKCPLGLGFDNSPIVEKYVTRLREHIGGIVENKFFGCICDGYLDQARIFMLNFLEEKIAYTMGCLEDELKEKYAPLPEPTKILVRLPKLKGGA